MTISHFSIQVPQQDGHHVAVVAPRYFIAAANNRGFTPSTTAGSLCAQNTVSGRYDTRFLRAAGLHCKARCAGPKPRVNLTRFHGVFAPNSKHRIQITPAKRGKGKKASSPDEAANQTVAERPVAMTWAQRLKRVFGIDIATCRDCGGAVKVIACIEDPAVIKKILMHSITRCRQQNRSGYRTAVRHRRSVCSAPVK